MAITPTRLNQYELIREIGAGGGGQVWLATDTNLERRVAIKLLQSALTDPMRSSRFEQEARAASSLNHPNVCTIHALEQTGDGQPFIAMEYIEGETLRHRVASGPLPLPELLEIGVQIASALTAAHTVGVVHRDVKPENVMLRPDGLVKVLDFGLAKLLGRDADPMLATRTAMQTAEGTVVGTVLYMSPEQARGLALDARTDVWSLGAVLYEMAAGHPPFTGPTASDVIAAILEHDYEPLARGASDVPAELSRIIRKALRKEPGQRYQVMKDLQLDLDALRDEVAADRSTRSHGHSRGKEGKANRGRIIAAISVALVLAIAAGVWWFGRPVSSSPPARATVSSTPVDRPLTRLTFDSGLQTDVAFSPDGRSIAYSSDRAGNFDIWVQSVDSREVRQITNSPVSETQPAWSPDGERIVFRSARGRGGLSVVPAQGGPERQLTSFGVLPVWSPDGSEILFRSDSQSDIYAVSPDGGEPPRALARDFLRGGAWYWIGPHPDGRISALGLHRTLRFGFYTVSRNGNQVITSKVAKDLPLRWTPTGTRPVRLQWNRTGTALFVEAILNEVQNVWRVRVDPATLEWIAAERLTNGSGPDDAAALSSTGTRMAFTTQRRSTRLWTWPLDASAGRLTGKGAPLTPEDERAESAALSPDGRFVAYSLRRAGSARASMMLTNIDANETELFAVDAAPGAWSPDSRTLAYMLNRPNLPPPGEWALAVREIGGPERVIRPWNANSVWVPTGWTTDGQFILGSYVSPVFTGTAKLAVWPILPSVTQAERFVLEDAQASLWQGGASPTGRWLSFVRVLTDDSSRSELCVARPGVDAAEWTHITPGHRWADKPRWSPNGRLLYFISNESSSFFNLWAVRFDPDRGVTIGEPFALTTFNSPDFVIAPDLNIHEIGISARRVLLTMETVRGNIWLLENVDR